MSKAKLAKEVNELDAQGEWNNSYCLGCGALVRHEYVGEYDWEKMESIPAVTQNPFIVGWVLRDGETESGRSADIWEKDGSTVHGMTLDHLRRAWEAGRVSLIESEV